MILMCNRQVTSVVNLDNAIRYICKKKVGAFGNFVYCKFSKQ